MTDENNRSSIDRSLIVNKFNKLQPSVTNPIVFTIENPLSTPVNN